MITTGRKRSLGIILLFLSIIIAVPLFQIDRLQLDSFEFSSRQVIHNENIQDTDVWDDIEISRTVGALGWNHIFPSYSLNSQAVIHITHVFSSYVAASNSQKEKDMLVIELSWLEAARYAYESRKIVVEFIDTTFPEDNLASPSFSKRFDLSWFIKDIRQNKKRKPIPTIGEQYKIAFEKGHGEIVVATNMDIGVTKDFYVRAYDWATKNYATYENQLSAIEYAAMFYYKCFIIPRAERDTYLELHRKFCADDAKVIYLHAGGYKELWQDIAKMFGYRAVQLYLKDIENNKISKDLQEEYKLTEPKLYERITDMVFLLTGKADHDLQLRDYQNKIKAFDPEKDFVFNFDKVPTSKKELFAGTITRLDLPIKPDFYELVSKESALEKVYGLLRSDFGDRHPGNDCFICTRKGIPESIRKFAHPVGLRPFGTWIPILFLEAGIQFRRISSTKKVPWTFHLGTGIWGKDSDEWRDRFEQNPLYFIFLAANFDRLSQGGFKKQLETAPKLCAKDATPWRQSKFCTWISNEFCFGNARYACERFSNWNLRDTITYFNQCMRLHSTVNATIQEPVASFCNFFLEYHKKSFRFRRRPGIFPLCETLGDSCS